MIAGAKKHGKKTVTQKRARKTRGRLNKAARDRFSEKSADSGTVEEITEKADLGKDALYQHFADKEEIVLALVDEPASSSLRNAIAGTNLT